MSEELKAAAERRRAMLAGKNPYGINPFLRDDSPAFELELADRTALANAYCELLAAPSPSLEACVAELAKMRDWDTEEVYAVIRRHWPTAPTVKPSEATALADEMRQYLDGLESATSQTVNVTMQIRALVLLRSQAAENERLKTERIQDAKMLLQGSDMIEKLDNALMASESAHAAMVERLISIFSRLGTVYMTEKAARQVAALSDEAAVALAESVPQAAKEGE